MAWIEWMPSISMITVLRMAIMQGSPIQEARSRRTESRVGARSVRPKRVLDLWLPSGQHQYEGDSTLLARRGAGSQAGVGRTLTGRRPSHGGARLDKPRPHPGDSWTVVGAVTMGLNDSRADSKRGTDHLRAIYP